MIKRKKINKKSDSIRTVEKIYRKAKKESVSYNTRIYVQKKKSVVLCIADALTMYSHRMKEKKGEGTNKRRKYKERQKEKHSRSWDDRSLSSVMLAA